MQKIIIGMLALSILSGCATNRSDVGYRPIVDLQGLDQQRYESDLLACEALAKQVDPGKEALAGMAAGAVAGALLA